MDKVKTMDDVYNHFKNDNNTFIQWKGTDVCMDFWCECGYHSHIDGYFAYAIKCNGCERYFGLDHTVKIVEIIEEPDNYLKGVYCKPYISLSEIREQKINELLK